MQRTVVVIARGRYLTYAANCEACHTADKARPFAGGLAFKTPFGTLYSPNITADKETGIGAWSDADFLKAVHEGIARDGERLYPAFPYAAYTYLTDDNALAIKAYLQSAAQRANSHQSIDHTFVRSPYLDPYGVIF
jgi:mono/diheme cytochrome c family protein